MKKFIQLSDKEIFSSTVHVKSNKLKYEMSD